MYKVITKPSLYAKNKKSFVATETLLAVVFLSSCLRFSLDPTLPRTLSFINTLLAKWLGYIVSYQVNVVEFCIVVIWSALITICGSYWIPVFWRRMLGISIERNEFVQAMIIVFCCFAVIGDITSPLWMSFVRNGFVPFWTHDVVRTIVVTIYSWKVGKVLTDSNND